MLHLKFDFLQAMQDQNPPRRHGDTGDTEKNKAKGPPQENAI